MTTATHRRRPADANDHRGRLSAGTLRGFQCGRIRLTQLAAAPTHRIHRLSRRQRPGRFAGVDYRDVLCHRPDRDGGRCGAAADQRCPTAEYSAHGLDSGCRHNPGDGRDRSHSFAQLAMGDSWRIGVDEQENTTLVRTGPFKWVRHPIYTAMMAFGLGLLLVTRISLPSPGLSCSLPRSRCMSAASKNPTCCGRTVPSTAATPPASAGSSRVWG